MTIWTLSSAGAAIVDGKRRAAARTSKAIMVYSLGIAAGLSTCVTQQAYPAANVVCA